LEVGPDLLDEVRGQEEAKRALEIAAAGGHHLLMVGPPGCGKSMLAERLGGLLPILENDERMEAAKIYSAAGLSVQRILRGIRPYRAPHHTVSEAGLVGGGTIPRPGEISLAHAGVLFLDELPEFKRGVLEALRAPLETGVVTISRARGHSTLPASVQLVAAMNPCPCGRLGASSRGQQACMCARAAIENYLRRVSQPILDRIDLQVELQPVSMAVLFEAAGQRTSLQRQGAPSSASSRQEAVARARARQIARQGKLNAHMRAEEIRIKLPMDRDAERLLEQGGQRLGLSARGVVRCLRVAATLADLSEQERIGAPHIAEALQYRALSIIDRYLRADQTEALTTPYVGV
jgi:magnesium chelatase family protein